MTVLEAPPKRIFVFYDLETTGLLRSGQIFNFCFIVTDQDLNEIDRFVGEVKLSALQLPSAGAIAATRINVLKHNETATYTEKEANEAIADFLSHRCYGQKAPLLIGYNSANFDVHQTRWSFARTGTNSFFLSKGYDVFQGVRDLLINNPKFRSDLFLHEPSKFVSIRLEKVAAFLGINKGPQLHHSEPDVELLIDVYRELNFRYGLSAIGDSIYRGEKLEQAGAAVIERPNLRIYKNNYSSRKRMGYVGTVDNKFALWIPLDKTAEAIRANPLKEIQVFKKGEEPVRGWPLRFLPAKDQEIINVAKEALSSVKTVKDLFPEIPGEFETWIYRSLDVPKYLRKCLKNPSKTEEIMASISATEREDLRYCLERLELDACTPEQLLSEKKESFLNFVEARYGGKMIIDIAYRADEPGTHSKSFHPDFATMYQEIEQELEKAKDLEVIECLLALKKYYDESPIKVAYEELVACGRIQPKTAPEIKSSSWGRDKGQSAGNIAR